MKHCMLWSFLALVLTCCGSESTRSNENEDTRPNIVVIMADDLGFSDVGCYGGEIHTPHIDYLADNGLRFTQFYNTSRCCPTRASLLTGLYNQEAGIGHMTMDEHEPGYRGYLTENTVTIAEVLKQAGYHTGMVGKWHVSNTNVKGDGPDSQEQLDWLNHQAEYDQFSPLEQYPVNRGFEKYFGTIWGVVDYFDPFSLVNGTEPVKTVPDNYYHTDAINDSAAAYIRTFSKENKPFFLYVAENAPHWPVMALPEDIEKYKDTYKVGWDSIREARYNRMVAMGLIDPANDKLSPRWKDDLSWKDDPHQDWDARVMAVHAAMVDRMDQGIGRIIEALRQTGKLNNTLILFLSDNGASPEICADYGPGFDRPGETRSGEKMVYAVEKNDMPGPETTYASIGPRWANVCNTPYRYWKAKSFEGGIHTPLIAFWPDGIKVDHGTFTNQVGHVMDFMATFTDLAHAQYPEQFNGHQITPMQGVSLLPVFSGEKIKDRGPLFNDHNGSRYARLDNWKLVALDQRSAWELYNLDDDGTELNNLASQHPGKVTALDSMWNKWAHENNVFPKPD